MEFKKYKRNNVAEMHAYNPNNMYPKEVWDRLSISTTDKENGSPKEGDMFARNPLDHGDMWLVAEKYFKENFEEIEETPLNMVSIAGKVVSYCEIPEELTEGHWLRDYYPDSYVQVDVQEDDTEAMDEVSEWIVNKYPELKEEKFFFIHIDY